MQGECDFPTAPYALWEIERASVPLLYQGELQLKPQVLVDLSVLSMFLVLITSNYSRIVYDNRFNKSFKLTYHITGF